MHVLLESLDLDLDLDLDKRVYDVNYFTFK
jgi:hypothetical protein